MVDLYRRLDVEYQATKLWRSTWVNQGMILGKLQIGLLCHRCYDYDEATLLFKVSIYVLATILRELFVSISSPFTRNLDLSRGIYGRNGNPSKLQLFTIYALATFDTWSALSVNHGAHFKDGWYHDRSTRDEPLLDALGFWLRRREIPYIITETDRYSYRGHNGRFVHLRTGIVLFL